MTRVTAASSVFLATIPSPDRGVWEIGPIPIRAYALCIIAGIILAIWWGERRWVARGGTAGTVIDIAVFAVPFGLVGGRLYHVATDWQRYFGEGKHPLDALRIWDGGLGIWGAIALGAVGAYIGCRVKGVPLPAYADAIAPGIVTAQAIGRVGNYFNQELYGAPTDLPWGLELYRRVNEQGAQDNLNGVAINHIPIDGSPVHPTFLYELIWNLLIAALVVYLDRKLRLGHGRAFAVYVMGYTLGRTWIELMRTDEATHIAGVRINVWVSILVFLGAAAYFFLARSRGEREDPELLRGKDAPPPDTADDKPEPDDDDDDDVESKADKDSDEAEDPDAKPDAKPDAETDAKDDAEPAEPAKAEPAKADKPVTADGPTKVAEPDTKPEAKAAAKPAAKAAAKATPKASAKTTTKPAAKPDAKATASTDAKPDDAPAPAVDATDERASTDSK
ncbi:prolipoprotein diacylglyceryl transferase [Actinophytocola oryzae]|uniref:Phosphatidylglycerol--prolipoprotein diacylglyceryl transferase n=1 Tax=Actinophytocola oryzae TaxID=502181 RepID=A0A4V3FS63_9PSEU|nr:prolipoprotein diacylglyceryl transferase [Actinophytocola oryzae]